MLGHKLVQRLSQAHTVIAATRTAPCDPVISRLLSGAATQVVEPAMTEPATQGKLIDSTAPDLVLNAIGIIKQLAQADDPVPMIEINALLPHRLAAATAERGVRLIHFSTDCVFSGTPGPHAEAEVSDARDLYGRTKFLGEVAGARCLTLRSSIIGHAAPRGPGLVDWVIGQAGRKISGWTRALYSGLTTVAMADVVARIIERNFPVSGLVQVSGPGISKFDLLQLIDERYELGLDIVPDSSVDIDRRLDSQSFRAALDWAPPDWRSMISAMHADWLSTGYDRGSAGFTQRTI